MIASFDSSGKILEATSRGSLDTDFPILQQDGWRDPAVHYVIGGAIVPRPAITLPPPNAGLGIDWTIADTPPGTEVRLDGALIGVTETQGPLSIAFPAAATYALTLTPPWPWLEAEITVTVNAP